ncbi:MAG: T9SS type A sorting domain-containing protein [Bacteroidales bacterium]|nr:T9SS type A sorting domain-containing protein [Bacteroidales bacterium]
MNTKFFLLLFIPVIITAGYSQNKINEQKATLVTKAGYMIEIPSISEQIASGEFKEATNIKKEYNPKRRDANLSVPGKGLPIGSDPLWQKQTKATKIKGKEPILTFEAASAYATPTDPTGAVGPNHFLNAWNSSFRIWDKEGNPLVSPASLGTIFPGETDGDPIVMYDPFADRFIVTQFTFLNGFLVAVSQGPDPVNSGWYTYYFPTNSFPDYPKFSLWSDGYYITSNKNSGSAGFSEVVYAIERDKMLIGDPDAQMIGFPLPNISTNGFYSPLGFNVNGPELPPPGNAPIVYMQDDSWFGVSQDHLKIWSINVDWDTPANSTISNPQIINTQPFDGLFDGGSFSNLPQPTGQDIDALQATIMYMAQYRRFSDHNAVVFNFVVDLDGSDDLAGIRWYELRQENDGDNWNIYQEGTYAQPEGHSAFSGNMCMDGQGNIGLAYTIVSNTKYPSLRYTGRYASDPLNIMTLAEESIAEGTSQDPASRYGDYSQMTIDPVDDLTFWSIGEYFTGGPRKNHVGVFKIAAELQNDVGIVSIDSPQDGSLTNAEEITITIRNFGINEQSDIPVYYKINDGLEVNEVFTGTIQSNTNQQFTFTTTGDFSEPGMEYHISAGTSMLADQNIENDTVSIIVTHLYSDDIGVTEISSPESGIYMSDEEAVSITVTNFGVAAQTDFPVSYFLNGGEAVTETVSGTVEPGSTLYYTFAQTADLSVIGDHELTVSTDLAGDLNTNNDYTTAIITNSLCQPELLCVQGVGLYEFHLGNIQNISGCDPGGYGDYTDLSTSLQQGSANDLTIATEYGDVFVTVWIDFNDNFYYEPDEIVVDNYIIAPGETGGNYAETISMLIPSIAPIGQHLMRAKSNYNAEVPADPCEETIFGETEDYTVEIILGTGAGDQQIENNDLILLNGGSNQFTMIYNPVATTETLILTVHNINGQTILRNRVPYNNGNYRFEFDMSYAQPGVYLLRLGSGNFGKIKRFYVK